MKASSSSSSLKFQPQKHITYFLRSIQCPLPSQYASLDTNRLTLLHFSIQSLDLLGALDRLENKESILEWIYSLFVRTKEYGSGFVGGTFLGCDAEGYYGHVHIAMTYTALTTLVTLGDSNLKGLSLDDRQEIIKHVKCLQDVSGSFSCVKLPSSDHTDHFYSSSFSEQDMRFLYCACCISYMLNDFSGIDKTKAISYIISCKSYNNGSFGLVPNQEGHGGSTFCAIASLVLLGLLDEVIPPQSEWRKDLIQWCLERQCFDAGDDKEDCSRSCCASSVLSDDLFLPHNNRSKQETVSEVSAGMQGRPNKEEDTCYSFWIGATLSLLHSDSNSDGISLLDSQKLTHYILKNQCDVGGFTKNLTAAFPDLLHSFYSLSFLSMSGSYEKDLEKLDCSLGMPKSKSRVFHEQHVTKTDVR